MTNALGWLLGIDNAAAFGGARLYLAAPWVQDRLFWLVLAAIGLVLLSVWYYVRLQKQGARLGRVALALCRGGLLVLLMLGLADPILELTVVTKLPPKVCLVFDGTESMAIADELPAAKRKAIENAVGWQSLSSAAPTRLEYVQALLRQGRSGGLSRLAKSDIELEAYLFEGQTTSQLKRIELAPAGSRRIDFAHLAGKLSTSGQVTALGTVLQELSQQSSRRLGAVVLVSDFANNSGPAPLVNGASPAQPSSAPLYTIGVGATEAVDLAVELQADPKLKKAERSDMLVKVRQSGLTGQTATVRLTARRLGGEPAAAVRIGERTISLQSELETIDFSLTPDEAGHFEFSASVDELAGEVTAENNHAERQVNIVDDFLRLMYVAQEPTWEWRFMKEVFHRDKLIGMEGFRTFLNSSDPQVRENNVLFLPTQTPKRSDFFATDVLIVDDLPQDVVNERFGGLVKEYVGNLGGGLIVMAGPRFGTRELYRTALADLLPVIIDPNAQLRGAPEQPEFRLQLTSSAARYAFMQLDLDSAETAHAWDNLGRLPWYQPVAMVHPQADVLAQHPTDRCSDGKTPQPLIAIRKYGKGEVVYLGFNEMWRLRRQYGEKYYRQFWSQLIYRLGMSHALGADKRFVVRVDQQQYRVGDKAVLSIEAYDENYEPLSENSAVARGISAEWTLSTASGASSRTVNVPMLRAGQFEAAVPLDLAGAYSVRVVDPVTRRVVEHRFEVTNVSAERQRAVRDERLQTALAEATGGRSYDLTNVSRLADELELKPIEQRSTRHLALWATPLWFGLIVSLMLGEWLVRKWIWLP